MTIDGVAESGIINKSQIPSEPDDSGAFHNPIMELGSEDIVQGFPPARHGSNLVPAQDRHTV